MKISSLIGERIKYLDDKVKTISHSFLIRGGYVKLLSTGLYSLLPLAQRISLKIQKIIREELAKLGAQELLMPIIQPAEIWKKSNRYELIDQSLLKFKDRNNKEMVLAMTCEEAFCDAVGSSLKSYKQLPIIAYQIQTKYRDEARPRAGLIRVREFQMKDAYSLHESEECLKKSYLKMKKVYENIFKRIGLRDVLSIESNNGIMGGNVSHEFMLISDIGEDTIFISPDKSYIANKEVAVSQLQYIKEEKKELQKVHTPNKKTIDEVAKFLSLPIEKTAKAVFLYNRFF